MAPEIRAKTLGGARWHIQTCANVSVAGVLACKGGSLLRFVLSVCAKSVVTACATPAEVLTPPLCWVPMGNTRTHVCTVFVDSQWSVCTSKRQARLCCEIHWVRSGPSHAHWRSWANGTACGMANRMYKCEERHNQRSTRTSANVMYTLPASNTTSCMFSKKVSKGGGGGGGGASYRLVCRSQQLSRADSCRPGDDGAVALCCCNQLPPGCKPLQSVHCHHIGSRHVRMQNAVDASSQMICGNSVRCLPLLSCAMLRFQPAGWYAHIPLAAAAHSTSKLLAWPHNT